MSVGFRISITAIYAFIGLPLAVAILIAFNSGTVAAFPMQGLSLRWFAQALATQSFIDATLTSLWLAAGSVALSTPLALAAAVGLSNVRFHGRAAVEAALLGPLFVPGIVIGIALLVAFGGIGFHDARLRMMAGHTLITLPYAMRTITASLAKIETSLFEGARTLGAGEFSVFWRITLPLLRPGIVAGVIFAFLQSFGDLPVSMFLADARNNTLPLAIMAYLEYNVDPTVAAISCMVTVSCLVLAILAERLVGLRSLTAG